MHYLGLDIGGTTIKAGLVDETGRVLESRTAPTILDDLDGFLSNLTAVIHDFQNSTIDAIGIGIPGLRSSKTHNIETSPNIPCLNNVNLEHRVAEQVHLPIITENDANAGAYAEFVCGAGAGLRHMAYLTIGTGLGSGLILNGSLYTGASGYGAEFGHTVIEPNGGRLCGCGKRGCLETVVSATGIVKTAREKAATAPQSALHEMPEPLTSEMIFHAAARGDGAALEVFKETGRYLGLACANLINLLNPEMIVIGGGVMASGDLLLEIARDAARQQAFAPSYRDCPIVKSKLWPDAGMIGAAMLARDR